MFDPKLCKGADISTTYAGIKLRSPFILSSGPLGYGSEGLIRAHKAGCGAVVTKTLRLNRAINPAHHIGTMGPNSLINCEKWADSDRLQWYEKEIPEAKAAGAVVIASVGHTPAEAEAIVADAEKAGADMLELVSYTEDTLLPMLRIAKKKVNIPVICKLSANWPDPVSAGIRCMQEGADALCAIDSIGPGLKIDIKNARPELMGADGCGWISGGAIKPQSMYINAALSRKIPNLDIYGSGGCMSAADAVEFIMAGCRGVGYCSAGILYGMDYVEKMCYELSALLAKLGYTSLEEARGAALGSFPDRDLVTRLAFEYRPDADPATGFKGCTHCNRCVKACCYEARKLDETGMHVDADLCRDCGVCVSICPTGALTATMLPQSQTDLDRVAEAAAFDEYVKKINS